MLGPEEYKDDLSNEFDFFNWDIFTGVDILYGWKQKKKSITSNKYVIAMQFFIPDIEKN